jgi:hypothetical protein
MNAYVIPDVCMRPLENVGQTLSPAKPGFDAAASRSFVPRVPTPNLFGRSIGRVHSELPRASRLRTVELC